MTARITRAAAGAALAFALSAGAAAEVHATCGGGGGGGGGGSRVRRGSTYRAPRKPEKPRGSSSRRLGGSSGREDGNRIRAEIYNTNWVDAAEAEEMTERRTYGWLHYFLPEGAEDHDVFHTKMLAELSKKYPCLRHEWNPDDPERARLKVVGEGHVVVVTDKYGNAVERFEAADAADEALEYDALKSAVRGAGSWMRKKRDDLEKRVSQAKKLLGEDEIVRCLQTLKPAIGLRGYDEIAAIEEIWGQALQKVDGKVAELKKLSKTNRGGARRELELLLEGVEGTDAEAKVRAAIDELK